jgi:hypothetical protein
VNPTSARPSASSDISFPSLKEEGQELPKPEKAPASLGTVASSPIEGNFQEESILPPEKPRRKGWWHRLTR